MSGFGVFTRVNHYQAINLANVTSFTIKKTTTDGVDTYNPIFVTIAPAPVVGSNASELVVAFQFTTFEAAWEWVRTMLSDCGRVLDETPKLNSQGA